MSKEADIGEIADYYFPKIFPPFRFVKVLAAERKLRELVAREEMTETLDTLERFLKNYAHPLKTLTLVGHARYQNRSAHLFLEGLVKCGMAGSYFNLPSSYGTSDERKVSEIVANLEEQFGEQKERQEKAIPGNFRFHIDIFRKGLWKLYVITDSLERPVGQSNYEILVQKLSSEK